MLGEQITCALLDPVRQTSQKLQAMFFLALALRADDQLEALLLVLDKADEQQQTSSLRQLRFSARKM
jgi:hypothetical protein